MKISRRKLIARLAFYGTPALCFGYGSLVEKRWIEVNRVDIPLPPDKRHLHGTRVALMADFHHDEFADNGLIRNAVALINDENVDAVMLAGDFISNDISAIEPLAYELGNLRPRLGTFGVLGNHDRWHYDPAIPRMLREGGIRLLVNEVAEFDDFAIAGADSCWGGSPHLDLIRAQLETEGKPLLLGWHEPDTFDRYDDPQVVLQMSGHTHGGQICAPFYGPILLPRYGRKYPFGYYASRRRSLYVSRGIGSMSIPARFLCRPEVAILRLTDLTISLPDQA